MEEIKNIIIIKEYYYYTSCRFSLKVGHPYDARTLVLHSHAGLSPDVLAELQSYRKYGGRTVVRTSWVHTVRMILVAAVQ